MTATIIGSSPPDYNQALTYIVCAPQRAIEPLQTWPTRIAPMPGRGNVVRAISYCGPAGAGARVDDEKKMVTFTRQ